MTNRSLRLGCGGSYRKTDGISKQTSDTRSRSSIPILAGGKKRVSRRTKEARSAE